MANQNDKGLRSQGNQNNHQQSSDSDDQKADVRTNDNQDVHKDDDTKQADRKGSDQGVRPDHHEKNDGKAYRDDDAEKTIFQRAASRFDERERRPRS